MDFLRRSSRFKSKKCLRAVRIGEVSIRNFENSLLNTF